MSHYKLSLLALAASSCLAVLPAAAQTGGATATIGADSSVNFGYPVGTQSLDTHRGGDIGVANSTLAGTTANNTAQDVTTGTNAISAGSFANSAGIPVVVQNSGANVLIQNAVTVNLQVK